MLFGNIVTSISDRTGTAPSHIYLRTRWSSTPTSSATSSPGSSGRPSRGPGSWTLGSSSAA
ncbi:unnamed protein product, partial [Musa acuminata var. zebrina]